MLRTSSLISLLITASFSCIIFSDMVCCLLSNGLCRNFILPEFCKPCLFLSSFQFAKFIVPYLNADEHRAANWDKNAQVSQTLIERLQSLPLTECEPEDLGEKLPGGSAIEIEAQATDVYSAQSGKWYDSNSRTYQLFENGLSVTLRGKYTSNTVCFSCTPSVLTETLVNLVSGNGLLFLGHRAIQYFVA